MKRRSAVALPLLLAAAMLYGCDRGDDAVERPMGLDEPAAEGLSPEEIRRQAEPMSPEQAEQRGIVVDTTIHVEQLATPEDTLLTPDTLPPPGTAVPRPRP
ncbi:hypothetical protein BH23GEM6_BH23GEM6_04790 [soil metagenome]